MFSLNSANSVTKICHHSKRTLTCHLATSCVKDQDATTAQTRHMWETRSLNWAQFMLKWFIHWIQWIPVLFRKNSTVALPFSVGNWVCSIWVTGMMLFSMNDDLGWWVGRYWTCKMSGDHQEPTSGEPHTSCMQDPQSSYTTSAQTQLFFIKIPDFNSRTNDKDKKSIQNFKGNISSCAQEDDSPEVDDCGRKQPIALPY